MKRLLSSVLDRLRLAFWRNSRTGTALVQPLTVRLDPGLRR